MGSKFIEQKHYAEKITAELGVSLSYSRVSSITEIKKMKLDIYKKV